jgi:hypothetical protein
MEPSTSSATALADMEYIPKGIPVDPLLLALDASVPSGPVPSSLAPTTSPTSSLISPSIVIPPGLDYQQISSPAPSHGFPVVSAEQEQSVLSTLSTLSLPSVLQLDMTIPPFAFLAAMPTAAEVVQICDVPESFYGRVKLEMYPIQVQKRAVMRMWRSFHWKWNNEIDVKKLVSKELNKRFLQSKRSYEKKMAKLATRDVANAAGLAAAVLPDAQTTHTTVTNLYPDAELTADFDPAVDAALSDHLVSSEISASEPAPAASSLSAVSSPDAAWSDPDAHLARVFLGDAYWKAVDYAIADDESGAFSDWGTVTAVGVLLEDWMLNVSFVITS